jgi:hypothetical protein
MFKIFHIEISQTMAPLTPLLYHWKDLNDQECNEMVFVMFKLMMQELLNIERFDH